MRLLNTKTGQFVKTEDPRETRYAILSHTWHQDGEQTYEQLRSIQQRYAPASQTNVGALFHMFGAPASASIWEDPELSPKIRNACAIAQGNNYDYIWIDSCCIDKSNSSELSEAINSMYKWYTLAAVCYVHLVNVCHGDNYRTVFHKSRWFWRVWTLQELIAPLDVEFLSEDWVPIGSKHDPSLVELVESITGIDEDALLHLEPLDTFSIAQRFSWTAKRKSEKEEDEAYSLFGIFGINMPILYGEGRSAAFRRLQEQIMQRIPDQSLFAWRENPGVVFSPCPKNTLHVEARKYTNWQNLFAPCPSFFKHCKGTRIPHRHSENAQLLPSHLLQEIGYTLTPYGIRTQFPMLPLSQELLLHVLPQARDIQLTFQSQADGQWYLAILKCEDATLPGHLLGHVCCIPPSKSSIDLIYCGCINVEDANSHGLPKMVDIFPLSPKTIEHYLSKTTLKTVYIPHTNYADTPLLPFDLRKRPYTTIKFVLQKKTHDALHFRGYSANLQCALAQGEANDKAIHLLTLAKDQHTITMKFWHWLKNSGQQLIIDANLDKVSPESHAQVNSALGSDQAGRRDTVTWCDCTPWRTELPHKILKFRAAGAGTLTVDLGLDFVGNGVYFLRVDVLGDAPPAS